MADKRKKSANTKTVSAKQKKKMTKRQKQKRKLILFGVEVVCLLFLLGILYVWSVVGKIDFNPLALGDAGINEDLADDTLVSDLMLGFDGLKYSVRKLSDNHVKTEDIGGDNILFNGDMYLLDLDLSLVDKRFVPDELYEATRRNIFKSLRNILN